GGRGDDDGPDQRRDRDRRRQDPQVERVAARRRRGPTAPPARRDARFPLHGGRRSAEPVPGQVGRASDEEYDFETNVRWHWKRFRGMLLAQPRYLRLRCNDAVILLPKYGGSAH